MKLKVHTRLGVSAEGRLPWFLALVLVLLLVGAFNSGWLAAQEVEADGDGVESAAGSELAIDAMLGEDAEILAGRGYAYDPGDRRDPFKSLLVVAERPTLNGPRPDGIPGLLIDEVVLSGIFATRDGYVAQVQAADKQKSYLVKVGDELFDGDVLRITRNEVVFKQDVQDPTALKPFREVAKSLNP